MAKHTIGAVLTLRDNMSATLRGVRREQSAFKKEVTSVRKELNQTFKEKRKVRLDSTTAHKKISKLRKALKPLRKKVATVVALKDIASKKLRRTHNKLKNFGRKTFRPILRVKDNTGRILGSVKKKLLNLKTLSAALAIGVGIGGMLGSGAALEQQNISMEHFISKNNTGMSAAEVRKTRDEYMNNLRSNANLTPFSTQEVISAGTRAINVAGGDTKEAMRLVSLAENMAALNPEKSLNDAMEALADLKVGESERMKEFGFKISQEDIEAVGGVQNIIKNELSPFFEGGAEKLSQSGAGLWSTIKGKIGSRVQDTGLKMLETLKPQMESVIGLIDRFSPVMDVWSEKIGSGVGLAIEKFGGFSSWIGQYMPFVKDTIGNVSTWVSEKFGWIRGETGTLKNSFKTGFKVITEAAKVGWKLVKPSLDLFAAGIKTLYYGFKLAFPYIKTIASSVWKVVEPILTKLGEALGWVADKAGKIAGWLGKKLEDNDNKSPGIKEVNTSRNQIGRTMVNGSHANGLRSVPFDGYVAKLHKKERVLTASESEDYNTLEQNGFNSGGATNNFVININGVNKSSDEIINELVPQLKLAITNGY